ncbi:dockerin type I repeat-containing protein [Ruminococcus flavefaciens]|uniref:dockerin type I repeat-containing protein n=1 Tax=Ruminococcus flavefaciens TaxID=1265 RepID=UPI0026EEBCCB|nr:dockerin type I repeat-containing protein [Ruminococcus flavefaciens]
MLKKILAAVIAASTAVISFSAESRSVSALTNVYAEETGAATKLPDWIPTDFESAVEFRNTYGATRIGNGLICIVYPNRAGKGKSSDTYGYELRTDANSRQILKHDIYLSDMTETCFEVFVYQPQAEGDLELKLVDPHVQVKPSEKDTGDDWEPPTVAEYTFNVDKELNITETDIYSWLPDSVKEFGEYTKLNGEVSVKDNYVVFCTVTIDQFGDNWAPAATNKNEIIKPILTSDCTMQVRDMYCDGSIDEIYVYQAVKDGNEKVSWTRTSTARPDPEEPKIYTLTADCAVFDNARSVLLANTARFSIVDGETGKLADIDENDKIFLDPDIRYSSDEEGVYASVDIAAPQMTSNPYYWDISQFKDADIFEIDLLYNNIPEGYFLDTAGTVVRKFDNGAVDYTFKLKKSVSGDVNNDGNFNISDIVLFQKWLLGAPDTKLANWKAADFCRDDKLDIFDLVLMRKALLGSKELPVEVSAQEGGGFAGTMILYKVYCEDGKYLLSYQERTFDQKLQSMVFNISEQEYREIMAQDYDSMIESMNDPNVPGWGESEFRLEVSYPDGSRKKAVSNRMPGVLTKLRALTKNHTAYVEPDHRRDYGPWFTVIENDLSLYLGPDESYPTAAIVQSGDSLEELGYNENNDTWVFTEYCGNYGWLRTVRDDNETPTIRFDMLADKPVIYLYPEQETDVHVELELTEAELSTTYPRYNNGWDVTASPDGLLLNKADGTHHKYLFWDAVNCRMRYDFSQGFCVAGSDTESFLKEKLTYMGLKEEEMNEFIVYWLPRMEHNAYNLISFQGDAYTNSAKLNIAPTPDSVLRVFMAYVPLEESADIEPQQLETFERKGFTVVEWGGSEIKP